MKKVFLILFTILLLGTINVKAEEEYNIVIDENNSFTLTDSSNNQITDNTIAKYEDNTLTLGEGKYFNQIKIKNDATITSNDKEVYIKELTTKEDSTYIPANININKLKVKEDDTYICKIDIGGNLTVNESKIDSKDTYTIKGSVKFTNSKISDFKEMILSNVFDDEYGIEIVNTELKCDSIFESNWKSKIKITNSNIEISSSLNNSHGNLEIRNRTENTIDNAAVIEDSIIKVRRISIDNGGIKILNSDVFVTKDSAGGTFVTRGPIDIIDSKVLAGGYIQPFSNQKVLKLNIENSEVECDYFYTSEYNSSEETADNVRFFAKNSKLKTNTTGSSLFGDNIFENCELDFQAHISARNNLTIINSTGSFTAGIDANNLEIKNSKLLLSNSSNIYYVPLSVKNDLKINNSNIIIENTDSAKIAGVIKNNIILDDKIVPIDKSKIVLNMKAVPKDEIATQYNFYWIGNDENAKIFTYDNESYTNYVQLATKKTATFKVKNGTWLDGTSDDIKIDYLYGEPLEVENLPKEVQELLTSKMGSWSMDLNNLDTTQDLDIEFKYDLINPETKRNLLVLFIITIISVVVFTKIKIKHVNT